jgi:cysteine desulfurase / selenocysteine lyase
LIYLDNAATTFPKPREVLSTMMEKYAVLGASPGRGSYDLSIEVEEFINGVRRRVCEIFRGDDPERVVFAYNATDALNILIQGLVRPGDHVVSTRLEHNSVLRPLHHLREAGIVEYDLVPFDGRGFVDPSAVTRAIRPQTRFVILNHASNVVGTVQPAEAIARACQEKGVPLILDVTQTAGVVPIDMKAWGVSAVAFTGHKSLLGPTGIGGLVLNQDLDVRTTRFGGTGIDSDNPIHTQSYPHRLEAGTINVLGVFGLDAGVTHLKREGMERVRERELTLWRRLRAGLSRIRGIRLYCADASEDRVAVLLCNLGDMDSKQVATILDGDFDIAVRGGMHCAPLVHADIGTGTRGGVRFSIGPFNTEEEIERAVEAMAVIGGAR